MKPTNLDITDFGARDDGRDCTAAIQAAINAAAKVQGRVVVPAGTFLCGELHLRPGVAIEGHAAWSFRAGQGSILRLNNPEVPCLLNLTGAFGAVVANLNLHGGDLEGSRAHGIMIDKPDYGQQEDTPRIDTVRVEHFGGDGIHLSRIWCFSVRHSHMMANGGCGIRVRGWDGFIMDNWLSGNGGAGYGAYEENASVTMTGNRIEWNRQGGIVIRGGSHYNITGNYIDRSGNDGIALTDRDGHRCSVIAATGNVIYRSGRPEWSDPPERRTAHVRLDGVEGITFTGNALHAGRDDGGRGGWSPHTGLVLRNLDNAVVRDNVLHQAALDELVSDLGGHGTQVVIGDNPGSLKAATPAGRRQ
jgi:hypothetical protein